MSHANKKDLRQQAKERFNKIFCPGRSKHQDKVTAANEYDRLHAPLMSKQAYINEFLRDKIYSFKTYEDYAKHNNYFFDWCKKEHADQCRTLESVRQFVPEWLQSRIDQGLSAETIKLEAAALGKLYLEPITNFGVDLPRRERQNIVRSRYDVERDKGFSLANNTAIIDFCRATGLRRDKELAPIRGTDLVIRKEDAFVRIQGKGGRWRMAPIVGDKKQEIIDMFNKAGSNPVFGHVPSHMDVHSYRADYATFIYKINARPLEELKGQKWRNPRTGKLENAIYWMRGDKKGMGLDRAAMYEASKALGHNRIDVVASHYIR